RTVGAPRRCRSADHAGLGEPVRARGQRGERRGRPRGDGAHQRRGRHHPRRRPLLREVRAPCQRAGHLRLPPDRRRDRHPVQGERLDQRRRGRLPGRGGRGLLDGRRGPGRGDGRHHVAGRERGRDRHGTQSRPHLRPDRGTGADPVHRAQRDGLGQGHQCFAHGPARRRQAQGQPGQGHQDHARHRPRHAGQVQGNLARGPRGQRHRVLNALGWLRGWGSPSMQKSPDQSWMEHTGSRVRGLLAGAGFAVAYAVASLYGDHFTGPSDVALYWPASGLAFAVVVIGGVRWVWWVPVAFAIQALWSPNTPLFQAMSAASNVLALSAGGWLARRETPLRPGTVGYAVWMMIAGLVAAAVGGGLGGYVLWSNGMAPGGLFGAQVLWALGDFLGIASVAPALMIGAARWQSGHLRGGRPQLIGERTLWNLALLASFLVMAWGMRASTQFALGLTALPLAVMMWSAVSFTPLRTSVSALLT